MTPQYFKGNLDETKIDYIGSGNMDNVGRGLDEFLEGAFDCSSFLLMLYDEGRLPFSDRIPREAFVSFLIECIANANFIGSYESYIFLITGIFGSDSSVFFEETAPGVLTLTVSASNTLNFDFLVRELIDDQYVTYQVITDADEVMEFSGFPGIESESELKKLLSEFVPAGIYADITLVIFSTSLFLVDDGGFSTVIDDLNNDIIFFELGG